MYIVFDIGGTKMRIAVSRDMQSFSEPVVRATTPDFEDGVAELVRTAHELCGRTRIKGMCGGVPGPLMKDKHGILNAPNLPRWNGKLLADDLGKRLDTPVYLENDAALAGLGETHFGAGRGFDVVAYLTISTGVGGARITKGEIDENAMGFEPGEQYLSLKDGTKGYLEAYVSGAALEKRYRKHPSRITDNRVWDAAARTLAYGIHNSIVHWSPDVVVLGGSMILKQPGVQIKRVEEYLKKILKIFPEPPPLCLAELGDFAGLHGALQYLSQKTRPSGLARLRIFS